MKTRIIGQITKGLNITEEYLANYLGITLDTLKVYEKRRGWEGKEHRIYRLNQIMNILRNQGIKDKVELKNILDNSRFQDKRMDESCSYITYILANEDINLLVMFLVSQLKINYIIKTLSIKEDQLCEVLNTSPNELYEGVSYIWIFYSILKYTVKKVDFKVGIPFFVKKYKTLDDLTLFDFINKKQYVFPDKLDKIINEFKQ